MSKAWMLRLGRRHRVAQAGRGGRVVAGDEVHRRCVVVPAPVRGDVGDRELRGQPAWTGSRWWPSPGSCRSRAGRCGSGRPRAAPGRLAVWSLMILRSPVLHSTPLNWVSTAIRRYDGSGSSVVMSSSGTFLPRWRSRFMSVIGLTTLTPSPPLPPGPNRPRPSRCRVGMKTGRMTASTTATPPTAPARRLAGAGADAEARRVDRGRGAAERPAPARDVGRLLEVHHQQEADRRDEEHDPRDAAAEQADRHAVDRQQRQPGQRDAPQPAGEDVHDQQAEGAAGDHHRRDAGHASRGPAAGRSPS